MGQMRDELEQLRHRTHVFENDLDDSMRELESAQSELDSVEQERRRLENENKIKDEELDVTKKKWEEEHSRVEELEVSLY